MKTFSTYTLGCKVNQYESQQIRELLQSLGLANTQDTESADLIIINTCCVTHSASAKCRHVIRKLRKENSNCSIIVTGCLTTVDLGELNVNGDNIHIIKEHGRIADKAIEVLNLNPAGRSCKSSQTFLNHRIRTDSGSKIKHKNELSGSSELPELTAYKGQTRAFLKVQDGCDGYCTYCIIPKTRPVLKSKPVSDAVKEAQNLVRAGHKEIVVTGIFLGAYGLETVRRRKWETDENPKLAELLKKLSELEGLERIRLSSLEPKDVTEELLEVMADRRNIMPHLHLSLQSGSDKMLKKMARQYRKDEFYKVVEMAKKRLDRPAVTTDVIVGFPGETEENFEDTIQMAKDIGFLKMHVFPFSRRKQTAAYRMQGAVNKAVIKERCRVLRELNDELAFKFRERFVEDNTKVLIEKTGRITKGLSDRYFEVAVENPGGLKKNSLVEITISNNDKTGAKGHLV